MDAFQSVWYRVALLFFAAWLAAFWFVLGPGNPFYAAMVAWGTCSLVPAVPADVMRRVPRQWFRVPAGERVLHRAVGIGIFGWMLDVCGWNRHLVEPVRGFSGKRAGLRSLEQSARAGAIAHGICFAIHVLLALLALFSRHRGRALYGCCCRESFFISTPCCSSAPSCFGSSLCWISRLLLIGPARRTNVLWNAARKLDSHNRI